MINLRNDSANTYIELLPNRSATWKQMVACVSVVAIVSLGIAIFWLLQGVWLIFPFTVLELSLLFWVVLRVSKDTTTRELLCISKETVTYQQGRKNPDQSWEFPRNSLLVEVTQPRHSLSPAGVKLVSKENKVTIGEKLNKNDVDKLIASLKAAELPVKKVGKTHIVAIDGFDL